MTTGVSAPMDFRYLRLVIPIFRTKKIKTAVRSSLFQAVGTTPFLGGERGSRTYEIIENHKISIRCNLSVYKIIKFIENHRVHFDI